jgi:hypothetical protein
MWNRGEPLSFTKRWNPFTNEIPFTTYTSHPLLWHKGTFQVINQVFISSNILNVICFVFLLSVFVILFVHTIGIFCSCTGDEGHKRFDVEDFASQLTSTVVQASSCNGLPSCTVENSPIILQNYVSLGSLIHNRNNLGFFKVRGKFSF